MKPEYRILNLGAGMQSTCLYLFACKNVDMGGGNATAL